MRPAIQLVAERLRQHREPASLPDGHGSTAAGGLKRGEVHVAGLHVVYPRSGESNLPFVRRHLRDRDVTLVTFASWEAGLLVRAGNPKAIRGPADLARKDVRLVNREDGSGARLLLDQRLSAEGIEPAKVRGYADTVASHLEVAGVAEGRADVAWAWSRSPGCSAWASSPADGAFDLVIPSALHRHPGGRLPEALVSHEVRRDRALGGCTRETGHIVSLFKASRSQVAYTPPESQGGGAYPVHPSCRSRARAGRR
jgi:hypothetical protein